MTLARLVARNALRHPVRAALLFGFSALSLFVGVFLRSIVTTLDDAVRNAATNRLTVQSGVSLFAELPASYRDGIAAVDGVESVNRWSWFGGHYRDPSEFFPKMAVDMAVLAAQYPEVAVPADQLAALLADRRGCMIGSGLATKYGLAPGDPLPIIGTLYATRDGSPWDFTVRAVYRPRDDSFNDKIMFLHWDFLDEVRRDSGFANPFGPTVTLYMLKVAAGRDATEVARAVDALHEAGPTRTHTQTEGAFRAERISALGNVNEFLGWIGGAVFLAMLLSVANAMGIAAQERAREVGVLKALGFPDRVAARTILWESLLVVGAGGMAGAGLAWASVPLFRRLLVGMLPSYHVSTPTLAAAAAGSLLLALAGGLVPSLRLARLRPLAVLREDL